MKTLGINATHDSSISVLNNDGSYVIAMAEERLNRRKSFHGWPALALKGIEPGNYHVAVAGTSDMWHSLQKRYRDFIFAAGKDYFDLYNERSIKYTLGSKAICDGVATIREKLQSSGIKAESLSFYDHHYCHAASAYYTSGFDNALVVTADGSGDDRSAAAYAVRDGKWTELASTKLPHSPGYMYSWVTLFLGFKNSRHEGKITGLAAFGQSERMSRLRGRLLAVDEATLMFENPYLSQGLLSTEIIDRISSAVRGKPNYASYNAFRKLMESEYGKNFRREDLAALAQDELENSVTRWIAALLRKTGLRKIAMAGGVFANVKLNQRVADLSEIDDVWIFPDMGDGGISTGAALLSINDRFKNGLRSSSLRDVYLGKEYCDAEILAALDAAGLRGVKSNDVAGDTARLIAGKAIVGWFQGRMEMGPRALGHRSILIHPSDRSANAVINRRLKRTEFMPFAPSVAFEYAELLFPNWVKSRHASEFMTITYDVNPEWVERLAAVVHVDNTARPQIVRRDCDELYWRVIDEFRKLTNIPAVVNTSFNMHEEPIVCSPDDAIRSFKQGAVDVLVMGNYFIRRG